MNVNVKKDLFAPAVPKKVKRKRTQVPKINIPTRKDWKEKHGSWAVMKGIIKVGEGGNNG